MYGDYDDMQSALAKVSKHLLSGGFPKDLCPMVFAVTGNGRVSSGSMEVLEQLPHIKVAPCDLHAFLKDPANKQNNKRIVISQFYTSDLVARIDGKPYDKVDYRNNS